ncbi:MAG: hypothetical protein Q4F18_14515, partial [Clostridia bacterium]|nr:hypothetical protein [Clostridia bacterium]
CIPASPAKGALCALPLPKVAANHPFWADAAVFFAISHKAKSAPCALPPPKHFSLQSVSVLAVRFSAQFLSDRWRLHFRKSLQITRLGRTRPVFYAISHKVKSGQWPLPLPKIAANRSI